MGRLVGQKEVIGRSVESRICDDAISTLLNLEPDNLRILPVDICKPLLELGISLDLRTGDRAAPLNGTVLHYTTPLPTFIISSQRWRIKARYCMDMLMGVHGPRAMTMGATTITLATSNM